MKKIIVDDIHRSIESLLSQKLIQISFTPVDNNDEFERLEFYGDSYLNFAITEMIFKTKAFFDPHLLTELRSLSTKNDTLTEFYKLTRMDSFIASGNKQEEEPKASANVVEALIGELHLSTSKPCKDLLNKIVSYLLYIGDFLFSHSINHRAVLPFSSGISQSSQLSLPQKKVDPTPQITKKPLVMLTDSSSSGSKRSKSTVQTPLIKNVTVHTIPLDTKLASKGLNYLLPTVTTATPICIPQEQQQQQQQQQKQQQIQKSQPQQKSPIQQPIKVTPIQMVPVVVTTSNTKGKSRVETSLDDIQLSSPYTIFM